MSLVDAARYASKTSLAEMNRPLANVNIFYTGSVKRLDDTTANGRLVESGAGGRRRSTRQLYVSQIGLPTADDFADDGGVFGGGSSWYRGLLRVSLNDSQTVLIRMAAATHKFARRVASPIAHFLATRHRRFLYIHVCR